MDETELEDWLEQIHQELDADPGTKEYLEVVEQAEEQSKHAEGLARTSRNEDRSLSLKSSSNA